MSIHKKSASHACRPAIMSVHGLTVVLPAEIGSLGNRAITNVQQLAEIVLRPEKRQTGKRVKAEPEAISVPADWLTAMTIVATNAWRAKVKMVDAETGEAKTEMQRVYRHIEAIFETLKGIGVETIDPTGRVYDSGMAMKVVSFEETPGLLKEKIKETIKPSVSWQGRLIQIRSSETGASLSTGRLKGRQ